MTGYEERPVYFPAGEEMLFGVLTEPRAEVQDIGVLAITGGGWIPGTHRNGMWVRLARAVAAHGFRTMRFDFHGVGESTGQTDRFRLNEPYSTDAAAALGVLTKAGNASNVMIGTCFGGRTAADAAAAGPKPAGVALVAVPLRDPGQGHWGYSPVPVHRLVGRASKRDLIRKLANAEHRRTYIGFVRRRIVRKLRRRQPRANSGESSYVRNLEALVEAGVAVLMVFGDADDEYRQYVDARQGELAALFERAGDLVDVRIVRGELHGFASLQAQSDALAEVQRWVLERFSKPTALGGPSQPDN